MSKASTIHRLLVPARRFALLVLLAACALCLGTAPARAQTVALDHASVDLARSGKLYVDNGEPYPLDAAGLPAMLARLRPAAGVNLLGGSYWLYAELRNDGGQPHWVIDPNDTLIDMVDIQVYDEDGGVHQMLTGYRQPHAYLLHYGRDIDLQPGQRYHVLIRFSSPYYARTPVFSVLPRADYQRLVAWENVLIIGAIGALCALAVFNFFIYSITRERSSLYYSLYVLCYAVAWGMTFHLSADLFGWHDLHWHYVPFFLLPVLSTLFYTTFLRLKETAPRLYALSRVNLVLPLAALPSCFLWLSHAHTIATVVIAIWMTMALATGIVVWRRGYYPARFFVLGFVALMIPGLLILPANVGLIPALVANAQLLTLLGGTLDGVLLAFALADQIRLLRNNLEQRVDERTAELTEAKEHAEVVSRHRIDFLSAMSHDIRTPLAGVIGMLKFALRDQAVRGRTEEYLRIGLQNSESLLAILNDILDFSKIDAGRLSIETVDFDLVTLIDDAVGILQQQADAKSLLLRYELALDLPRYVRGDPTRLRQILLNLLGNAIKFTDRGEVRLDVSALQGADGRASVSFDVSDTGPGIPPETLARLFRKFEQADHSTTRRYGGTGLGLAICKELVELMGGAIAAESRVGAGSTFSFTLPLMLGAAPSADPATPPRKEHHAYRLRVLCAEDVRTNQIIVSTLLEGMGHDIRIVENGLQALHALSTAAYDLVLMDGRMPMMDGEQAARLIRAGGGEDYRVLDPDIPIIALTANASDHDRARYLAVGMDGFLSKPVDERLLYDQVEKVIAQHLSRGRPLRPTDAARLAAEHADALDRQFGVPPDPRRTMAPDTVHIMPLAGMSHKHMQRITQAFLDEAPRRLQTARAAVVAGNSGAAAAAIHALKGSAGYLSSTHLHALCHAMEAAASAGDLGAVRDMLPRVEAALDKACADLRAAAA
ncbi:signal transduction histidine kinase/CheY-like chemotaxis protein/HPt (histidine-containing phosphotransfer) domain-containing protein [Duganella sp. SG902]|uniref:hybrid sensor histidine kinase/response regulator n=1 Tax=Duganella sp. SG902 TaxID=2587016 RepID=UPI00159D1AEB|nr:hybrid sensor histidine kinase/response regulator [Duganella sp. SG902]NVM79812.1 signal transduction histidine kinase/CheY-like chemotaxis protein/HPt (histidine-containing phosphotransfer) domain-containing protein [Duganella sp. SG902]